MNAIQHWFIHRKQPWDANHIKSLSLPSATPRDVYDRIRDREEAEWRAHVTARHSTDWVRANR